MRKLRKLRIIPNPLFISELIGMLWSGGGIFMKLTIFGAGTHLFLMLTGYPIPEYRRGGINSMMVIIYLLLGLKALKIMRAEKDLRKEVGLEGAFNHQVIVNFDELILAFKKEKNLRKIRKAEKKKKSKIRKFFRELKSLFAKPSTKKAPKMASNYMGVSSRTKMGGNSKKVKKNKEVRRSIIDKWGAEIR